jgi:hypothetical protein
MNTTERKLVAQANISTDTKSNSLKAYLGTNSLYLKFHSSLKTKKLTLKR